MIHLLRHGRDDVAVESETYPLCHVVIVDEEPSPPRRTWMIREPFDWEGEDE